MLILHSQYHGCWCLGDTRSQGIINHVTDLVIPKYVDFSTKMMVADALALVSKSHHQQWYYHVRCERSCISSGRDSTTHALSPFHDQNVLVKKYLVTITIQPFLSYIVFIHKFALLVAHCPLVYFLSILNIQAWIIHHTMWDKLLIYFQISMVGKLTMVPALPLPTKTYTTLVPKLEKYPLFVDSGRKKTPFSTEITDFEVQ